MKRDRLGRAVSDKAPDDVVYRGDDGALTGRGTMGLPAPPRRIDGFDLSQELR